MRTPVSALPSWPKGLDDIFGRGPLPLVFLAAAFFADAFATLRTFFFRRRLRFGFHGLFGFFLCHFISSYLPVMPAKAGIQ
jgi:hypothetical protein